MAKMKTNPGTESVNTTQEREYPVSAVNHEELARLAYCYWQDRGCPIGSPEQDWYRAENELRKPIAATAAS